MIADFGLAAFSMLSCRASRFALQRALEKGRGRANRRTLCGISRIPSDNTIRDTPDEADPALLRPCFECVETLLAEPALRQVAGRLGGRTPIAWDGTEHFSSQKLGCPSCQTRKRANVKVERYHSLPPAADVAPGWSKVIPLKPEFIAPRDGAEKQDCERNAIKRCCSTHGARLAALRPISLGDDFLFTAKQSARKTLYDFIAGAALSRHEEKVRRRAAKETFRYCWIEAVPIRDGEGAFMLSTRTHPLL